MRRAEKVFVLLFFFFLSAGAAMAQDASPVTLVSEVLKEVEAVNEKGEKEVRLVPVASAMPGEVLIFRVTYRNEGTEPAANVQLTNPVPGEMVYIGGTAEGKGADVAFSVDSGQSFARPAALTVTAEDGTKRPAEPADYTHIRWQIQDPVPPGREGTVSFRASLK